MAAKDYSTYGAPQFLLDFLSYVQTIKGKSPQTAQSYFYDLRLFLRFLLAHYGLAPKGADAGSIDISRFDPELLARVSLSDLYSFMSYVSRERENASHARARKVASLKSFFNYLHAKAKIIDRNPASELESPKTVRRLPRYLGLAESQRLLEAADGSAASASSSPSVPSSPSAPTAQPKPSSRPAAAGWLRERDYAIMALFLNCGMRLSELVGINIGDMRADTLTIVGKGDKERTVYLNQACRDAVSDYLRARPQTPGAPSGRGALFLSKRKQRISKSMVQHIVKKYIGLADLDTTKYSTHKLRHTAATLMYQHGNVDIRALQAILGHASIATTEIYTHLDSRQLKDAVDSNPLAGFRPASRSNE